MQRKDIFPYLVLFFLILLIQCKEETKSTFISRPTALLNIKIIKGDDSLRFLLPENTYTDIKSFNYFKERNQPYISFYDKQSQSINIYDFSTTHLVKRLSLKETFKRQLYKNSVFVHSFDTIFLTNFTYLYLMDSTGRLYDSIEYKNSPTWYVASLDNANPPILQNGILYTEARPRLSSTKKEDLEKWEILYSFDLKKKTKDVLYHLPKQYINHLYGYKFFYPSYCYNDADRFVFSFPASQNIFETDLKGYHNAYAANSQFHAGPVQPSKLEEIELDEGISKDFLFRDSYGSIYFDPLYKRYIRVAQQKITKDRYRARDWDKKTTAILLDSSFRIIAESPVDTTISLNSLFFTEKGHMYARIKSKSERELQFVRLVYQESPDLTIHK